MTDINPQWRYKAMTEQFGACGVGWTYEIINTWSEQGADGVVLAFAKIALLIKVGDVWSKPIPGIGGSTMVAKETSGLYSSDECYKMAVTDALSVAMKMLGVAADIYEGLWDGSKYRDVPKQQPRTTTQKNDPESTDKKPLEGEITEPQKKKLWAMMKSQGMDNEEAKAFFNFKNPKTKEAASNFIENFDLELDAYDKFLKDEEDIPY
jgi:hypothetical protein